MYFRLPSGTKKQLNGDRQMKVLMVLSLSKEKEIKSDEKELSKTLSEDDRFVVSMLLINFLV